MVDVAYWVQQRFFPGDLAVTVLDVGQGQAVLIELPNGQCMLVDGGGFHHSQFDVGRRVVAPLLWRKKIATVETLVLSHPDSDHLDGLLFVARHFNVHTLWTNRDAVQSPTHRELLGIASRKNMEILGPAELKKPRVMDDVAFEVLYPPPDFLKQKKGDKWRTPNNNSLVIKVTLGSISFLLPGDIEAEAEHELVNLAGHRLKSRVLVVPHHGSKTSSTARFLAFVDPSFAIVSSGKKNAVMPHQKVLERYRGRNCQIFRTDQQGAITMITDGTELKIFPFLVNQHSSLRAPASGQGVLIAQ
jgi:competence protein ComEC